MTKQEMELMNLRSRVAAQREEIKRLHDQCEERIASETEKKTETLQRLVDKLRRENKELMHLHQLDLAEVKTLRRRMGALLGE